MEQDSARVRSHRCAEEEEAHFEQRKLKRKQIASRALIGVDLDPYLNSTTSPVHVRMARADSASLMPIIPGAEDRIANYLGWLTLSDFPKGDGTALSIAGYELPFHYIHVSPSTPGDIRPTSLSTSRVSTFRLSCSREKPSSSPDAVRLRKPYAKSVITLLIEHRPYRARAKS